jgi:hypothetical protein
MVMSELSARDHLTGWRRFASPTLANVLGALSVLLVFAAIPVQAFDPATIAFNGSSDLVSILVSLACLLSFAAVGVIVARRQPYNPMGWLLLAVALVWELSDFGAGYADLDYQFRHGTLPLGHVALLAYSAEGLFYGLLIFPLIILLFPDGRLGPRWRWPLRGYAVICALHIAATLSVAAGDFPRSDPLDRGGNLIGLQQPPTLVSNVEFFTLLAVFAMSIAAVVHQVRSYRCARMERRQQLKWLVSGAAIIVLALPTFILNNPPELVQDILPLALVAVPVTIGIGILKYRLYEIDRLISRTLSYAIVTALLAATFVGLVVLSTRVLPLSSTAGVAASTLAAAALFNPLRIWVQRRVDRRFNRARYDAEATVAAFASRLRTAVDLEVVQADLLATVRGALEPSHVTVWTRVRGAHHSTRPHTPG